MAGTARTSVKEHGFKSEVVALREEHNKAVTDLETLRAAIQAGGVTLVNEMRDDMSAATNNYQAWATETKTDIATIATFEAEAKTDIGTIATFDAEVYADSGTIATFEAEVYADSGTIATFEAEVYADSGTIATFDAEVYTDSGTIATFEAEVAADTAINATWETEVDGDLDKINDYLDLLGQDTIISGNPAVQEGTGDTTRLRMAGTNIRYRIGGLDYLQKIAIETEPPTGEITGAGYGAYRMELSTSGTMAVTRKADPMNYASYEDAMLSLGSLARTAASIDVGYASILAAAGGFTAQTDLPIIGDAQVDGITWYQTDLGRALNGLNSACVVTADAGVATLAIAAVNVNVNGVKLAEIAVDATHAMDDADTVGISQWGGWLLVVDPAGTGTYALAADGIAGTVSVMTYADKAAVDTALDLVQDRIPAICPPIARIYLNNVGGADAWVAGTDNWDTDTAVATVERYPVAHSRVSDVTTSMVRPTIPASVTAPVVEAMTAPAVVQMTAPAVVQMAAPAVVQMAAPAVVQMAAPAVVAMGATAVVAQTAVVPDALTSTAASATAVDAAGDMTASTVNA